MIASQKSDDNGRFLVVSMYSRGAAVVCSILLSSAHSISLSFHSLFRSYPWTGKIGSRWAKSEILTFHHGQMSITLVQENGFHGITFWEWINKERKRMYKVIWHLVKWKEQARRAKYFDLGSLPESVKGMLMILFPCRGRFQIVCQNFGCWKEVKQKEMVKCVQTSSNSMSLSPSIVIMAVS